MWVFDVCERSGMQDATFGMGPACCGLWEAGYGIWDGEYLSQAVG